MSVLTVIQARMGSSRLPGKVLAPVGDRPMLAFQLARLAVAPPGPMVVATSTAARDDAVADVAGRAGVAVVRGDEDDVLGRFLTALDHHPADDVVRLTADCPLADPALVAEVVTQHRERGADYTSNVHPRSYPKGLDVEVVRADVLRSTAAAAVDPAEREHVTPFVVRHPERFALSTCWSGDARLGREWWTVDRPEDLEVIQAMVAATDDPIRAPWRAYLDGWGRRATPAAGELWLRPEPPQGTGPGPRTTSWTACRDERAEDRIVVVVEAGCATVAYESGDPTPEVAALVDAVLADDVQVAVRAGDRG